MLYKIFVQTVLLFSLTSRHLAEQTQPCLYLEVGENTEISLNYDHFAAENDLTWTYNQTRVYRQRGTTVKEQKLKINSKGSLILENIQLSSSGIYSAQVYGSNGKHLHSKSESLCVLEPLPEPTMIVECGQNRSTLICDIANRSDVSITWKKHGIVLNGQVKNTLILDSSQIVAGDNVSCTVSNQVNKKTKVVQPQCSSPEEKKEVKKSDKNIERDGNKDTEVWRLLGVDFWTMVAIIAGGAGLIFILLIICIVCVCRSFRRHQKQAKDEEELTLATLLQPDSQQHQKMSNGPTKSKFLAQRPLPSIPSDQTMSQSGHQEDYDSHPMPMPRYLTPTKLDQIADS